MSRRSKFYISELEGKVAIGVEDEDKSRREYFILSKDDALKLANTIVQAVRRLDPAA
jgi:hypothetical protein